MPDDPLDDDRLLELADALALHRPIPDHLAALWEAVGRDPELLGRIEDLRDWLLFARTGAGAPAATIALDRRQGLQVSSTSAGAAVLETVAVQRAGGGTELRARVRLGPLALSIGDETSDLVVRAESASGPQAGVHLSARAPGGALLAEATTDREGVARLRVGQEADERLVLALPSARAELSEI
jgi:hypothetical protein